MYDTLKVTRGTKSTATIEGELSPEELLKHRASALKALGAGIEMPGFRKGHVPEKILVDRIGEGTLLQEMAERALSEHYPKMLSHHAVDAIGRPAVTITKLAPGNPLGFKIETAILPKLELSDYKGIAQKHVKKHAEEKFDATDEEVDAFIQTALRERGERAGKKEAPLPELTDELVREFGAFENVADFKTKIRDGILHDKKFKAKDALRAAILNEIGEKTKAEMPDVLVEAELDRMYAQFMRDIERFGLKPEQYLEHIKKTEDDLRKEWRADAEKAAKQQLILHDIGVAENIRPTPEEIQHEVDHVLSHHKDAKRQNVEAYVATALANQKVIEFLEKQA